MSVRKGGYGYRSTRDGTLGWEEDELAKEERARDPGKADEALRRDGTLGGEAGWLTRDKASPWMAENLVRGLFGVETQVSGAAEGLNPEGPPEGRDRRSSASLFYRDSFTYILRVSSVNVAVLKLAAAELRHNPVRATALGSSGFLP
ncbi:hypothetical protein R1flu_028406 [Riccia fluitans]|uniref:Uncharacterized protein n=1 Tax=Riccia fluitans TaxID=41844 RepID=A0ABD1XLK6_9MARC